MLRDGSLYQLSAFLLSYCPLISLPFSSLLILPSCNQSVNQVFNLLLYEFLDEQ